MSRWVFSFSLPGRAEQSLSESAGFNDGSRGVRHCPQNHGGDWRLPWRRQLRHGERLCKGRFTFLEVKHSHVLAQHVTWSPVSRPTSRAIWFNALKIFVFILPRVVSSVGGPLIPTSSSCGPTPECLWRLRATSAPCSPLMMSRRRIWTRG